MRCSISYTFQSTDTLADSIFTLLLMCVSFEFNIGMHILYFFFQVPKSKSSKINLERLLKLLQNKHSVSFTFDSQIPGDLENFNPLATIHLQDKYTVFLRHAERF